MRAQQPDFSSLISSTLLIHQRFFWCATDTRLKLRRSRDSLCRTAPLGRQFLLFALGCNLGKRQDLTGQLFPVFQVALFLASDPLMVFFQKRLEA